jgi:hypothetical protein
MTASDGQRALAQNLYDERVIPDPVWDRLLARMNDKGLMPRNLRADFDEIIKANYPRRRAGGSASPAPTTAAPGAGRWGPRQSRYALPSGVVADDVYGRLATRGGKGDAIFFEVKLYRGRWYCRKLTGAPGSFTRSAISAADQRALHRALAGEGQQERSSRLFGYLHTCCGVCGAELTDDYSREVSMGPHCRKDRYGYTR